MEIGVVWIVGIAWAVSVGAFFVGHALGKRVERLSGRYERSVGREYIDVVQQAALEYGRVGDFDVELRIAPRKRGAPYRGDDEETLARVGVVWVSLDPATSTKSSYSVGDEAGR